MNNERKKLGQARRWVVKLGSSLLTNNGCGLRVDSLQAWVNQMMDLRKQGCDVVVVSSGATAEGVARLGWKKRPHAIHELQAAAAVGQMGLVQAYETCFPAIRCAHGTDPVDPCRHCRSPALPECPQQPEHADQAGRGPYY